MPFAYFDRLSARGKAIYRRSDAVTEVPLPSPGSLRPLVEDLRSALARDERREVESASQKLTRGLVEQLELPPLALTVLAVRPSSSWGELHGLYTRETRGPARVQLWMRTVRHRQVVAFRTFLRTLLHELGHHVDYERLSLADSYHTEGFFRRESSLFRQLVPDATGQESVSPGPGRK